MYFIQPSRHIPYLEQVLDTLPSVQMIRIEDIDLYDPTIIAIADIQDYLDYKWTLPTIVLAFENEGSALAQAWELGALAGWMWNKLPSNPQQSLLKIDAQYKRNQDSRDLPSAAELQQRLLPNPIELFNYQVETYFQPSAYLSGDWYDYWKISDKEVMFYLADVSGHGASSAFVTIWLKHLVSRMVREEGLFGDENSFAKGANVMLRQINRELHETRLSHHLTLFVGVIDTHTNQMHYVVAGHLPMPILVTPEGASYLNGRGKPVGIFKDVEWEVYECTLPEKFGLVCFSDGVLEIMPDQELQQKEASLLKLISSSSGGLDSVCNTLVIKEIRDNPDDIAVLSISRGVS